MVGWALRPYNRRENLDSNCRLGYLVVGWVYARETENLDRDCRVG